MTDELATAPTTPDWLVGARPTSPLPRERLEERILNLLHTQNVCVLATIGPAGPLATPVRYHPLGLGLLFTASPRSPKVRNIVNDPRTSVGVVAPFAGLASSRGAQLFGAARVLGPDHPDHARFWPAYRWENEHVERGLPLAEPPKQTLVVVEPDRIVYTEHWLRREGFAPRQFWHRTPRGSAGSIG